MLIGGYVFAIRSERGYLRRGGAHHADGAIIIELQRHPDSERRGTFIECSLVAADARRARESKREQERLQLELQRQQAVNALQAAALKTWRLKLAAVSAVFLVLLAGGALWVLRSQAHQERLKFRAEDLVWQVDARLSEVANATTKNAKRRIQRVAAQAEQAFNDLLQSAPDNIDVLRSHASVWETIGDRFRRYAKDSEAALSAYRKAQDVRRRLVDKNIEGQQDSARRSLVVNLENVGITLAAMRATDALAAYEEALATAQKLAGQGRMAARRAEALGKDRIIEEAGRSERRAFRFRAGRQLGPSCRRSRNKGRRCLLSLSYRAIPRSGWRREIGQQGLVRRAESL
jgi:hypothetical protein